RQRIGGFPVFQSETRLILDREGRPVRSVGRIAPGLDDTLPSLTGLLPASTAARAAGRTLGIEAEAIRPIQAEMVLFPLAPGVAVPAWSQVFLLSGPADYYILVDAKKGTLLYRKNIRYSLSSQEARFSV